MDARTPLQPAVVTPKQALSIKPFGLDMGCAISPLGKPIVFGR
jgi:hypothetical protein